MRLCIPTLHPGRLDALLSPHFGAAPFFTLVDPLTLETEVLPHHKTHTEHGGCTPVRDLEGHRVDMVVCRQMGKRALEKLQDSGIRVFRTEALSVADVVAEFGAGGLVEMDPGVACSGRTGARRRD